MYPNNYDTSATDVTMIAAVGELHQAFDKLMDDSPRRLAAYRRVLTYLLNQARNALHPAVPSEWGKSGS